ncbi:MAG: MoaD/ThiS family protein [Gemmatimonadetes bacterium]|nr:MoaD/ThiS family protein [Gemmatimonadota bacterium]NNM03947.1 MoaD/ThiS family protein [Gemmatimonadota bacterium]
MSVMKIKFYAALRDVVGEASVEVDLPEGSSAQKLLDLLVTQHPGLEEELTDEGGHLHGYLKMFINGREVVYLDGQFQHVLDPGDTVDIFPPVGGG